MELLGKVSRGGGGRRWDKVKYGPIPLMNANMGHMTDCKTLKGLQAIISDQNDILLCSENFTNFTNA